MPVDDGLKKIDNEQPVYPIVLERLGRCVSESETTDDDIKFAFESGQAEGRQLLLRLRKEARHEVFISELDLKNVEPAKPRLRSSPERQVAERRLLIPELLDHRLIVLQERR